MRNLKTKRSAVCHWNKKISNIEESVFEQNKLLQSSEKSSENVLEIIDKEIKVDIKNSKEELRKQRVMIDNNNNNNQSLFHQFYLSFKYSALVLESTGGVAELYRDLLGVYRVVGENTYKKDEGESYIYYSHETNGWKVGTITGHSYCWLKNLSNSSPISSSSTSTISMPSSSTSILSVPLEGWQYKADGAWCEDFTARLHPCTVVPSLEQLLQQSPMD